MGSAKITLQFDLVQTTAVALLALAVGYALQRRIKFLRTFNIPEPVIGGLAFSLLAGLAYYAAGVTVAFDMSLQSNFMLIFFATVGLAANLKLLLKGGPKVFLFLLLCTIFLVIQDSIGVVMAYVADMHPAQGLLMASITQSGGHGTGATYAALFAREANMQGVLEIAMAAATFGLVFGGLIGGPVAKWIIDKFRLAPAVEPAAHEPVTQVEDASDDEDADDLSARGLLETLLVIGACMVAGLYFYGLLKRSGITLPSFVCVLFVGLTVCNVSNLTGVYRIRQRAVDIWGSIGLSLFLAEALMSLKLWELLELALPMIGILTLQALHMALFARFVTFRVMGKDYDAAVIAAGHCGFGLGATPTAVANMEAAVKRYGPSPQAFLVVPMVGAFFIDITNALVIQFFLALPWVK